MTGINKLRVFRVMKGLTQEDLGEKVGCNQSLVSKIERKRYVPDPSLKKAIADVLGRDVDEVF
ncbi:MAG: helix-turn-helix transcriptional regulator [Proteobacteria bacterium]|nr:helix-turn-helix transcriptional regulator [Pseudomonadota bacterium]